MVTMDSSSSLSDLNLTPGREKGMAEGGFGGGSGGGGSGGVLVVAQMQLVDGEEGRVECVAVLHCAEGHSS